MKIRDLQLTNFGSYKSLYLDLSCLGLALISGATGSGKSTVPDAISWLLFGVTSKDLNADEVRSWNAEEPTSGEGSLELEEGKVIKITRIRGKPSENDLYFIDEEGHTIRGKNIIETQKILEVKIGTDSDLFFTSSYFHQFSKADTFFISKASDRRELFEKIADQSLAIDLGDKASEKKKVIKKSLEQEKSKLDKRLGILQATVNNLEKLKDLNTRWSATREKEIHDLQAKYESFEQDKEKQINDQLKKLNELLDKSEDVQKISEGITTIESELTRLEEVQIDKDQLQGELSKLNAENTSTEAILKSLSTSDGACPVCMGSMSNENKLEHIDVLRNALSKNSCKYNELSNNITKLQEQLNLRNGLKKELSNLTAKKSYQENLLLKVEKENDKLNQLSNLENKYLGLLESVKSRDNPYTKQIVEAENAVEVQQTEISSLESSIKGLEHELALLHFLYELSFKFRGVLLSRVIESVEADTNKYLEKYFDSEVKVLFKLEESDKLEVEIQKNGNQCSFKALSGGQRCLLKLCFWMATKKAVENKIGKSVSVVSLDESMNGLDNNLKEKAFGLLQELESTHSTVLVIEHSDSFKNLFSNELKVSMLGDTSIIEQM